MEAGTRRATHTPRSLDNAGGLGTERDGWVSHACPRTPCAHDSIRTKCRLERQGGLQNAIGLARGRQLSAVELTVKVLHVKSTSHYVLWHNVCSATWSWWSWEENESVSRQANYGTQKKRRPVPRRGMATNDADGGPSNKNKTFPLEAIFRSTWTNPGVGSG